MIDTAAIEHTQVTGLTCDSRKVEAGFLFAALPGSTLDGRNFIMQATRRGAVAILAPLGTEDTTGDAGLAGVAVLTAPNPRRAYAQMAARFYQAQPASIAAVSGTNGKTSVVCFARQIWTSLGLKAASMGTLGISAPGFDVPDGLTTPDPVDLHRNLAELTGRGVQKLAMEASSHGLDQYRLDGVNVGLAGFTNLSRDHLDYHGSMETYLKAKLRLFGEVLATDGVAVLNADDAAYPAFKEAAPGRVISYGRGGEDIHIENIEALSDGQRLTLRVFDKPYSIKLPLAGAFQVENALCALGLVLADGGEVDASIKALEALQVVPGRLQLVARCANGATIYVDYAHTPDALANVLTAMRPHTTGQLHVVFGCGGDRDAGKRPQMGRAACQHADDVIVTDDNPRSEDASLIRAQAMAGCPGARDIAGRARAIDLAVAGLRGGDLLIVAGKGHETGQTIKGEVVPFNDADEIRRAVAEAGI